MVVQNGIIENERTLREELQEEGVVFRSETDTEVTIPHLLSSCAGLVEAGGPGESESPHGGQAHDLP